MIRNTVPWPDGARCACAFTVDKDADSLIHVACHKDRSIRSQWDARSDRRRALHPRRLYSDGTRSIIPVEMKTLMGFLAHGARHGAVTGSVLATKSVWFAA